MSDSMVLIRGAIYDGEKKIGEYTGSGVVVAHDEISSLVLTAAHVCKISPHVIDRVRKESKSPELVKQRLSIMDRGENVHSAMAYVAAVDFDVCLIQIPKAEVKEIKFSSSPPATGDPVFNISAPFGHYSKTLAPMFRGYYSGTGDMSGLVDVYSIPAAGGSSGSHILNSDGEIIGVVSATRRGFHHLTISARWEQIKQFLEGRSVVSSKQFLSFKEYAELVGKMLGKRAQQENKAND